MPFRFDAADHSYWLDGEQVPSITQMLERCGWVDSSWYTEESAARGTAVHDLTAAYDLGALDSETCASPFCGFLLAHVAAVQILRPTFLAVEEPYVNTAYRFGGRPDRRVLLSEISGVWEEKTGAPEKSHAVQTALQCILVEDRALIPSEYLGRWALYLKPNGKWRLQEHTRRQDFDEARRILKRCCA